MSNGYNANTNNQSNNGAVLIIAVAVIVIGALVVLGPVIGINGPGDAAENGVRLVKNRTVNSDRPVRLMGEPYREARGKDSSE